MKTHTMPAATGTHDHENGEAIFILNASAQGQHKVLINRSARRAPHHQVIAASAAMVPMTSGIGAAHVCGYYRPGY